MAQIEDGTGTGKRAKVNTENQLVVSAITEPAIEHESEENGSAYIWASGTVNIDAADTVLLLKNTSDTPLHIEHVQVANGALASEYTIHLPTADVTPAGNAVIGTNMNTGSSNVAEADAQSDETANTQGNILFTVYLAVDDSESIPTPGLVLAKNKSLAVDVVADTTESAVSIVGHYAD